MDLRTLSPVNNNVIVSLIEEYESESWIVYKRDSEYDHMMNAEVCCKIELVGKNSRLCGIELPMYFMAMIKELYEIGDWYYTIHDTRVKWLLTKPIFKNDFSRNIRNVKTI